LANLQRVTKQTQISKTDHINTVKFALLNIRSLFNKSFLINDLICAYNLDFLFLTETWLDLANNASALIESAPPNYNFMSSIRSNKKGGGIATISN